MRPTDFANVSGATSTYLMNGNPPGANWTALFKPEERIRLRFINGSAMTLFDVRIPGLPMTVVQADGNDVEPVEAEEFRIAVAETYDAVVQPRSDAAYTIFAQSLDHTGFACGTLAARPGMAAEIPAMDPRPLRTMVDMGMDAMHIGQEDKNAMPAKPSGSSGGSPQNRGGTTPFQQPGPDTVPLMVGSEPASCHAKLEPSNPVDMHLELEVDMLPEHVTERLDEPGDGLNNNGRRVLTYADLRAPCRGADGRPPTREIELYLSGDTERYLWGFNGEMFSQSKPNRIESRRTNTHRADQ